MVTEALDANPQSIEDFKNGKDSAIGFSCWSNYESDKRTSEPTNGEQAIIGRITEKIIGKVLVKEFTSAFLFVDFRKVENCAINHGFGAIIVILVQFLYVLVQLCSILVQLINYPLF